MTWHIPVFVSNETQDVLVQRHCCKIAPGGRVGCTCAPAGHDVSFLPVKVRCLVQVSPFPGAHQGYLTDGQDKRVLLFSPEI